MRIFEFSETVTQWIQVAALALEVLTVAIIVVSIVYWIFAAIRSMDPAGSGTTYEDL